MYVAAEMALASLRFDKCVVHQRVRTLQRVSLQCIASKAPFFDGSEQIPGLWTPDCGLWHEAGDRPASERK